MASRLAWLGPIGLTDEQAAMLVGPGAPFELHTSVEGGRRLTSFVRRAPNLPAALAVTLARMPDRAFLVTNERSWTFAEAARDIDAMRCVLVAEHGVRPGDRVGIVSANSAEYALAMWAIVSAGAVVASLNGWWTSAELARALALVQPRLVLGDERRLARLDGVSDVPVEALDALWRRASTVEVSQSAPPAIDEDDPAVILFTSGTTGFAKGVTLSHRNIVNFAMSLMLTGAIGVLRGGGGGAPTQPASILSSPMFHVSGMVGALVTGAMIGTKQVFPPPGRWSPATHLALTDRHRISTWTTVPTQLWRILREPDLDRYDLSCLQTIGCGGAVFAPELVRELHERLPWVMLSNGYGMSETVGLGVRIGGDEMLAHPESVGSANPTVEIEIRGDDGEVVAEGEIGEIHLRTPSVFRGYWNDAAATKAALSEDGWYRSGDFGRISGGRLYLESRRRDLILRGGENIYPIEIENRLVEHPDIDDAAVIGVEHAELGQEVKAFVVVRAGARLGAADVQRWAAEALAAFKVPAHVELRDALPYTETGKLHKQVLESEEAARRTRAR